MRVHELAKQLSGELGKTIASSELLVKLNKKKDFVVRYKKSCYIKVSKWFHEEVYK